MNALGAYSAQRSAAEGDALVTRHAELVKRIAYHLAGRLPPSVEVTDLIQAGMLGLLEAAANYAANRGASFETYAGIRIRGAMIDALRKLDWAPRSVHRKARAVASVIREIERQTGRDARDGEVAAKLGVPIEELPEREKLVMSLYYSDELNLKEIGAVLKVTESRVCQLHGQALVRLRARLANWCEPATERA